MITMPQIISKKMFLFTLLATTSLSFANLSKNAISDVYANQLEGAAKYLEFHFVFKPNNTLQTSQMNLAVGIGATAATGLLLATKTSSGKDLVGTMDNPTMIASGMLCIAAGYAVYCATENLVKYQTLIDFLKNWSYHRQFLPEDFTAAFDQLFAYQQAGKKFSTAQVDEIFELVLHYIEHSFEKRYPKEKKSPNLLTSLKTITEIGKNCAPGK
jgi:hypothetical protein